MRVRRHLSILGAMLLLSAAPLLCLAQKKASQGSTHSSRAATAKAGAKKTSARHGKARRRERGQKAPTPERIREIQAALARESAYTGEPNGKWDAESVEAMKRFQAAHELAPSGKVDARSLQRLGLGSKTAGAAPPRPPSQALPATILRPQ